MAAARLGEGAADGGSAGVLAWREGVTEEVVVGVPAWSYTNRG